jgi:hypothetical protein
MINNSVDKKITTYDKSLRSPNIKIDGLSSSFKNQPSFNKMLETR